ncbi:MAG: disulfide bond formation protein DsbA [Candidatus Diapherotrites archaeon CG11_big_fil_rev_8_21_14_0_20_37_9]|nr:MAG: disulfide bond formation protein DsbA [Candidatus Diapherotrites archaeon CG11_big_fil_rev_8_21_14_0_20_37_9]
MSEEKQKNETQNNAIYLPASIIVATLILSATLFIAAGDISTGLTALSSSVNNIKITGDSGSSGGTIVAAPNPSPSPQPSDTTEIKALFEGVAAKEGSDDAEIVIIEYSDYQCPFCRSWYNQSKSQLNEEYIDTGKVQFIYKDFPLNFHPMAQPYAEAARCAGGQGKYWEMHDKIFDEQSKFGQGTISNLTQEDIKTWASDLGLDTGEFNSCLDSGKYTQEIQANLSEGQQVGVSGTPSFIIGKRDGTGQLIVGAQPYATFKSAIEALLN